MCLLHALSRLSLLLLLQHALSLVLALWLHALSMLLDLWLHALPPMLLDLWLHDNLSMLLGLWLHPLSLLDLWLDGWLGLWLLVLPTHTHHSFQGKLDLPGRLTFWQESLIASLSKLQCWCLKPGQQD